MPNLTGVPAEWRGRMWILPVLIPLALSAGGANGENSTFSCGGSLNQISGTCGGDGGIDCIDGGTAVASGSGSGSASTGGSTSSAGASDPGTLTLTALPSNVVAPGQTIMLAAAISGTQAQIDAVQTMNWFVWYHGGQASSFCNGGSGPGSCLGGFNGDEQAVTEGLTLYQSNTFYMPYATFADPGAATCSAEPNAGLDLDITAFTTDDPLGNLTTTLTIHVECPEVNVTPTFVSLAPGGTATFAATENGVPTGVNWTLASLDGSEPSGAIDSMLDTATTTFTASSDLPSGLPFVEVVATSVIDPSASSAALVWLTLDPIVVTQPVPGMGLPNNPLHPYQAETFQSTVENLSQFASDSSVIWTLAGPCTTDSCPDPQCSLAVSFVGTSNSIQPTSTCPGLAIGPPGGFNGTDATSSVTVLEGSTLDTSSSGSYTLTAISGQDQTKSAFTSVTILSSSTLAAAVSPAMPSSLNSDDPLTLTANVQNASTAATYAWSLSKPSGSTSALSASSGLTTVFTAGLQGPDSSEENDTVTFTVTDPNSMNSPQSVEVPIVVDGPASVSVSPSSVTSLLPGDSATFTTSTQYISTPNQTLTWKVVDGSGADITANTSPPYFDQATGVFYSSLLLGSTAQSYTLTATAATLGSTIYGQATIAVRADPNGIAGTVTYSGSKTGTVYVTCTPASGDPTLTGGTTAIPSFQSGAAFRIFDGGCPAGTGQMVAWMDYLGVQHFVYGADPEGSAAAPATGSNVTIQIQDYQGATPPAAAGNWPVGTANPAIADVLPLASGAVVTYTPYTDGTNEYAQSYNIYYETTASGATPTSVGPLTPGTFGTAFVPINTAGTYQFAIQAVFKSLGGSLTTYPATLAYGNQATIPPASTSITGSADLTALKLPSANSDTMLYALVFPASWYTGLSPVAASAGVANNDPVGGIDTIADFETGPVTAGNYGLTLLAHVNAGMSASDQQIDPADSLEAESDPLHYLESDGTAVPFAEPAVAVTASPPTVLPSAYVMSANGPAAMALTDVTVDSSGAVQSEKVVYVVTSGSTPVIAATETEDAWDPDPGDQRSLLAVDHRLLQPPFRRNMFVGSTSFLGSSSPPAAGDAVTLNLTEIGGAATLTPKVLDVLAWGNPNVAASATTGLSWNAATAPATGNTIDHYYLKITTTALANVATADVPAASACSGSTCAYNPTGLNLTSSTTYDVTLEAIDSGGDRVWTSATPTAGP